MKDQKTKPLKSLESFLDAKQPQSPSPVPNAGGTTVPGRVMANTVHQKSQMLQENETLKTRVEQLEADPRSQPIDPALIDRSDYANRDDVNFIDTDNDFAELKELIRIEGRNTVPVLLRSTRDGRYEIVYGHRRVEACRQLGIRVQAIVDHLDDKQLFVAMDLENRSRKNNSPLEQGRFYKKALERGLFPSNKKMAEALGCDLSTMGKAIMVAELPNEVIKAFRSPLEIQFRYATALREACIKDLDRVKRIASELVVVEPRLPAGKVFAKLISEADCEPTSDKGLPEGLAAAKKDASGRLTLRFSAPLSPDKEKSIFEAIALLLKV